MIAVQPESFCLADFPDKTEGYFPAVFRFGKQDPPGKIEVYHDELLLRDKASAIHIVNVEFSPRRNWQVSDLWNTKERPTSVRELVAWTQAPQWQRKNQPLWFYRGYIADWSDFDSAAAKAVLRHVPRKFQGLTRVVLVSGEGRAILREIEAMPSGYLGAKPNWKDSGFRCRASNLFVNLCAAIRRQRPATFEEIDSRHVIKIPTDNIRRPLVMAPVTGGPPPYFRNELGYSGDAEIGDKYPASLKSGNHQVDGPHDLISKYFIYLTIDWSAKRIVRVFMVEIDPSIFN